MKSRLRTHELISAGALADAIFESSDRGIVALTFVGESVRILRSNAAAMSLLGIEGCARVGGLRYEDLPEQARTLLPVDVLREVRERRRPECRDISFGSRGPERWCHLYIAPVENDGVCVSFEEITDQLQADIQIAQQQQRLIVQAAELELRTQELERARKIAETASQTKSDFLSYMSHEIRTPMTAILGYTVLLVDDEVSESERLAYIQTIRRNGDHLLTLINDILDHSKIEAGRLEVERIECSLVPLVDDVIELMRVRAKEKGLTLDVAFELPLPHRIHTDPIRFRQILVNLVGNAVKFTDRGGVRVMVRMDERSSPLRRLAIDVHDTGIGMSPEQLGRLFSAYTQVDAMNVRRAAGTGLGLTISRRLAHLLGGDVTVRSESGKGTTFTVTVDAGAVAGGKSISTDEELDARRKRSRLSRPEKPATVRLVGRVLLAEDGPDNQRHIAHVLRRAGLWVEVAADGQAAVEVALSALRGGNPFDIILMDVQMPVLDGISATRRLRAADYEHPIVALTASAMDSDRVRCLEAGCDEFAVKPIDRVALLATIERVLRASPMRPGA